MTGKDLKKWRQERGLTQQQLAQLLGVIRVTVARWETGSRGIPRFLPLALEALNHRLEKGANEKQTIEIFKINEEPKEE